MPTRRVTTLRPREARITPEILTAYLRAKEGDHEAWTRFHVLTKWRPWHIDPLDVDSIDQPPGSPADYVNKPFEGSWWQAKAFRDALEAAPRPN